MKKIGDSFVHLLRVSQLATHSSLKMLKGKNTPYENNEFDQTRKCKDHR